VMLAGPLSANGKNDPRVARVAINRILFFQVVLKRQKESPG
jgi:hypothetical protein